MTQAYISAADSTAVLPARALNVLVMMPALNEQATVADVIARMPRDLDQAGRVDVLVIDDGSTDRTAELAREAGARVVSHGRRRGVGAAFQTALSYALENDYDIIITIDADGQFAPETIPALADPVIRGQADFATASRFADPALVPDMPRVKRWGNRQMSRLISHLTGQHFADVSCGMRCYNRRAALSLNVIGAFTYTQEVFLNLAFKGLRMVEVPIAVRGVREHGKSRVASSILRYAFKTSWIIFRCYRDYFPLRFFGRLAACFMIPGVLLELWLLAHYLMTGRFTGHQWAGFTGAGLFFVGLVLLLMGILGDMLDRHRIYLEEMLYHFRSARGRDRREADDRVDDE